MGGRGYWGQALAHHHRTGRSKSWFGLVATIFDRAALLGTASTPASSRARTSSCAGGCERAGSSIGVSRRTVVAHRFGDGFGFAGDQWLADGKGLVRMVDKQGLRGLPLLGLPLPARVRGIVLALLGASPAGSPTTLCYGVFNYVGDARRPGRVSRPASAAARRATSGGPPRPGLARGGRTLSMAQNSVALILAKVATMGLGFLFWLVAARLFAPSDVGLASGAVSAMMLITQLALFGVGSAVISLYPRARRTRRRCSTAR